MKKVNSMITRSMAAVAALAANTNPYETKATEPKNIPLVGIRTQKKVKYNFMDMMLKPNATKKYVNGKLKAWQKKYYTKAVRVGRGALGARERAYGVHWLKTV